MRAVCGVVGRELRLGLAGELPTLADAASLPPRAASTLASGSSAMVMGAASSVPSAGPGRAAGGLATSFASRGGHARACLGAVGLALTSACQWLAIAERSAGRLAAKSSRASSPFHRVAGSSVRALA